MTGIGLLLLGIGVWLLAYSFDEYDYSKATDEKTVYVWMRTDERGHVELTDEDRGFPRIPPKITR